MNNAETVFIAGIEIEICNVMKRAREDDRDRQMQKSMVAHADKRAQTAEERQGTEENRQADKERQTKRKRGGGRKGAREGDRGVGGGKKRETGTKTDSGS